MQSAITTSKFLSLEEEGVFNHSGLNHTAFKADRGTLVIVNTVDRCYQREFMSSSVNVSPSERRISGDMKAETRLVPTFRNPN